MTDATTDRLVATDPSDGSTVDLTPVPAPKPPPSLFTFELSPDQALALEWVRAGENGRREWNTLLPDPEVYTAMAGLVGLGLVTNKVIAGRWHYELTTLGRLVKPA